MIPAHQTPEVLLSDGDQCQNVVLHFFFQKSNDEAVNTASAALRTIIHQFIRQVPILLPTFLQRNESLSAKGDFEWSWENLSSLFAEMLEHTTRSSVYIILDAVDESETDSRVLILDWIKELIYEDSASMTLRRSQEKLKILVTSRPDGDMVDDLLGVPTLEISNTDTTYDIEALIQNRMTEVARRRHLKPEVTHGVIRFLESNAYGMFLWVVLVMKELERRDERLSDEMIASKLSSIPLTLADTYEAILHNVPTTRTQDFWRIIRWLLCGNRSLSLIELETALCLETAVSAWHDFAGDLNFLCGSFTRLEGPMEEVHFVHQTARGFLDVRSRNPNAAAATGIAMETDAANEDLASTCVQYLLNDEMLLEVREFLSGNAGQSIYREETNDAQSTIMKSMAAILNRYPFLQYAIESWAFHARAIGNPSSTISARIRRLLSFQSRRDTIMALIFAIKNRTYWGIPYTQEPVHLAAYFDVPWLVRRYISENKNSVHATATNQDTPLIWAAEMGSTDCVRELLSAGADPNTFESDGWSALHWAARNGHARVARLLLEHGASFSHLDAQGNTPLDWAMYRKHWNVVSVLNEWTDKDAFEDVHDPSEKRMMHDHRMRWQPQNSRPALHGAWK